MPDVVVVGGGIIGCATAFELSQRGARVTLIERAELAAHLIDFGGADLLELVLKANDDGSDFGDLEARLLLDQRARSRISTIRQCLFFEIGRVSATRTRSPSRASFVSSCT